MQIKEIDGSMLKAIVINGAVNLEKNKKIVDDLNVFPVPDGDTGTNMSLTIQYAADELKRASEKDLSKIAQMASSGALMGARGNSGVILSQLFRGFAKGCENRKTLNTFGLANALKEASAMSYKAVMRPIEGTILTVAREMAEFAVENASKYKYMDEMLLAVIEQGKSALANTPEQLPVLKEAGVVDSGGKGLLCIIEGAYEILSGKSIPMETTDELPSTSKMFEDHIMSAEDITFGYCTEFIILSGIEESSIENTLKENLASIGDSVIVVGDEEKIKVHVHTDQPDKALNWALEIGSVTRIKIDNMREQVANNPSQKIKGEEKEYGFISVAAGDGLEKLFKSLGVDEVIEGGQTMNPSTQDFLNKIEHINAKHIFILPNNSNILLAANQAKEISQVPITVISTKSIPQGISALLAFNLEGDVEENTSQMNEAIQEVKTGQVTYAVRDTSFNSLEIKKDDIIGILEKDITAVGQNVFEVTRNLIENMIDEDTSLLSLYYGAEIEEEDVNNLIEELEEKYSDIDIEGNYGGQSLYYFILSVE
ncbi:DAK2 domain-containing protein [Alkalibaculum bacchi]|uniref:DAK2 domain-containing protein n=1 Tax=Alkalibaculum bacchi TaxID=645887 RepID=UPI0026EC479F|nr:DAK2 domain-containing protein [Alkalibaculum bacchi]